MENHLGLFGSASSSQKKPKAKRRKKADAAEFVLRGGSGAARIIRSAGRKDRHSKVCTARGTRDRRVRLSPKTAIEFYDVQDRLGYDRPSKAIDWLMKEASAAIGALAEQPQPPPAAATNAENNYGETQQIQSNDANPISSFGFFTSNHNYEALHQLPDHSDHLQAYSGAGCNNSAIFGSELYESEYQRGYSSSAAAAAPLSFSSSHFSIPGLEVFGGHGQICSEIGEPLQSSYSRNSSNHNPVSINRFPGFDFSNDELHDFTATLEEDETDRIPVSGKSCSTDSFLRYED